jgi:hypothetical protein
VPVCSFIHIAVLILRYRLLYAIVRRLQMEGAQDDDWQPLQLALKVFLLF